MLTVGSLFSGIDGLGLGLERAGMRVVWRSEIDPYASAVLRKHSPDIPNLGDIRTVTEFPPADVLAGGFPCQPVSVAGHQLRQRDERWLWPEFARAIRLVRPRYVIVENVPGLLHGGMGDVLGDLAELGFDAEWDSVPAAAVGAPHLRYRVWLVAYPQRQQGGKRRDSDGERRWSREAEQAGLGSRQMAHADRGGLGRANTADEVNGPPLDSSGASRDELGEGGEPLANPDSFLGHEGRAGDTPQGSDGRDADRGSLEASLAHPNSERREGWYVYGERAGELLAGARRAAEQGIWSAEPDVGRVAHGVPSRIHRLRTLGNAVVPQVAEWLGRCVVAAEGALS